MKRPLEGILVLEFAQYLAAPAAGLRLADLGARVIKIERPGTGEAGRRLTTKNLFVDGDSIIFHAINRNKESFTADLKAPSDLEKVKKLIARADVMTHNFRAGVMEKIGLDYASVKSINPRLVYGVVTGYGKKGPWRDKPGQYLLAQSLSGLTWLSGNASDGPTPFGIAVGDIMCGMHLAQGVLAALVRRAQNGQGALVEASLLESLVDLQFEVLTTYFNDGGQAPRRCACRNAHPYLGAPYGIYETSDGWIALAMGPLPKLKELLGCDALDPFLNVVGAPFAHRDEIKSILASHLKARPTGHWLAALESGDYWCADVFSYGQLRLHPGFATLGMEQTVRRPKGATLRALRCPIRIDGQRLCSEVAAPSLGNANESVAKSLLSYA